LPAVYDRDVEAGEGARRVPEVSRFPIRFGRLGFLFVLVGLTARRSYLELEEEAVRVRMGWAFSARVPRPSIRSVRRDCDRPWSIGVHGFRGRWIVNGAAGPIVAMTIDPVAHARANGVQVKLRELLVSIDDPDALVAALGCG
jgi:hypothetical protein